MAQVVHCSRVCRVLVCVFFFCVILMFAEDGVRFRHRQDGTRSFADLDLRQCSGRRRGREKATRTIWEFNIAQEQASQGQVRAFQVVVGTEAIPSGLPRFTVWPELLQRWAPRILQRRRSSKVQRSGPRHRKVHPPASTWMPELVRPRERVARLEQGHCSNGELPGAGVDMLVTSLKKAQKDAQEMPLEAQNQSSRSFHRTLHEEDRTIRRRACRRSPEVGGESEKTGGAPGHGSCSANCTTACRCQCRSEPTPANGVGSATTIAGPSCTTGRPSATEEEVLEWLADRQEDMNTALMAGNPVEAGRISGSITDASRSLRPTGVEPSMVSNVVR